MNSLDKLHREETSAEGPAADPGERNASATSVFRRDWSLYDKLLQLDVMRHREVYATLGEVIAERFAGPFTIADLGCGDASWVARSLQGTPVRHYFGIDLVDSALAAARVNLAPVGCEVELITADFSVAVRQPPDSPVDLLLASYSLHHLSSRDKAALLQDARRWLGPRGAFVLIDIVRRDDETRASFLDRYLAMLHRFTDLTPEDRQQVLEHMLECDWPEPLSKLQQWAGEAGFGEVDLRYRDSDHLYAVLCCLPQPS